MFLVTGITGKVGGAAAKHLLAQGQTAAAEAMFDAVNSGWMDLGVEGTEHVSGAMSARDVFRAAQHV